MSVSANLQAQVTYCNQSSLLQDVDALGQCLQGPQAVVCGARTADARQHPVCPADTHDAVVVWVGFC